MKTIQEQMAEINVKGFLTKDQILKLFNGWHLDPEQPKDWLRLDKGIADTDDTVCYIYFFRSGGSGWGVYKFDRIDFQ